MVTFAPNSAYTVGKLLTPNITLDLNGSTLTAKAGLDDNLIRNKSPDTGNANIIIRNGHFEGNSANQSPLHNPCHAIAFYHVANARVENCTFNDFELDGVYIGRAGSIDGLLIGGDNSHVDVTDCTFTNIRRNGISVTRGKFTRILRCSFTNCNAGVVDSDGYLAGAIDLEPNNGAPVEDTEIGYCTFTSSRAPSIQIAGSASKKRANIHHCTFDQITRWCVVAFTSIDGLTVADCEMIVTNGGGVWVNGQGEFITHVMVARNQIAGNGAANLSGIGLNYVPDNAQVGGNMITGFARGVGVYKGSVATLDGNIFVDCGVDVDQDGSSTVVIS